LFQVSWSLLTPYRLVTAGGDGLARTWDIREACLKRYGKVIGKRPEYRHDLLPKHRGSTGASNPSQQSNETNPRVAPPPLPVRDGAEQDAAAPPPPQLPVPPLPPGGNNVAGQNGAAAQNRNNIEPGLFVAGADIDEGVKLLSKLQHGAVVDEHHGGHATRSRRSTVKVICVARCSLGGHFATGSDDGICRVWRDDDDSAVKKVDDKVSAMSGEAPHGRNEGREGFKCSRAD
jgi:WD40 repeat protein